MNPRILLIEDISDNAALVKKVLDLRAAMWFGQIQLKQA